MLRHILAALGWAAFVTLTAGAPVRRGYNANGVRCGMDNRECGLGRPSGSHAVEVGVLECDWHDWPTTIVDEAGPCSPKRCERIQVTAVTFDNLAIEHDLNDITQ